MEFVRVTAYQRTVFTAVHPNSISNNFQQANRQLSHCKNNESKDLNSKVLNTCQYKENIADKIQNTMKTNGDGGHPSFRGLPSALVSEKTVKKPQGCKVRFHQSTADDKETARQSSNNSGSLNTNSQTEVSFSQIQGKPGEIVGCDIGNSRLQQSSQRTQHQTSSMPQHLNKLLNHQDKSYQQNLLASFQYPRMPDLYLHKVDDQQNNAKPFQTGQVIKNYSDNKKVLFVKLNGQQHSSVHQKSNDQQLQVANEQINESREQILQLGPLHNQMPPSQHSQTQHKTSLMQNNWTQQNYTDPSYNQNPSMQRKENKPESNLQQTYQAEKHNYRIDHFHKQISTSEQPQSQQKHNLQQTDWTQKQTCVREPSQSQMSSQKCNNQIQEKNCQRESSIDQPQNQQESNFEQHNMQEQHIPGVPHLQRVPVSQHLQNQHVHSSLDQPRNQQESNFVERNAQEQNFLCFPPLQRMAPSQHSLNQQVPNLHQNLLCQNESRPHPQQAKPSQQPITMPLLYSQYNTFRQPQTQDQILQSANSYQQMPPSLLPVNQLPLNYQQNISRQLENLPPPPPLRMYPPQPPIRISFPYFTNYPGQPQPALSYGYGQSFNPPPAFPSPWTYSPVPQPVLVSQPPYEPSQMIISQNATSADGRTLIGMQGVNPAHSLYQVAQISRGTQNMSHNPIPTPQHIQLHLNKPKIINLFPSMLSHNPGTDENTVDESMQNNLLSLSDSLITQIKQMDKHSTPKNNTEMIQSNQMPTCSKYLPQERTNSSAEAIPSTDIENHRNIDPPPKDGKTDREENETLSVLKSKLARCGRLRKMNKSPVIKLTDVKFDEKAAQSSTQMEPLTADIISSVLSPVLWTTTGLNHPLGTSQSKPSEDCHGEKREHKSQNSEGTPNKRKYKKKKK